MKIGIDGLYLQRPTMGVGRYLSNLINNLPQISESSIQYYILSNIKLNSKPINHSQVIYHEQKCPKILWKNIYLPFEQRRSALDILFLPNYTSPLIKRNKTVVCIHDIIPIVYPNWSTLSERLRFSVLVKQSTKTADQIITVSETTKNDIIKYLRISEDKISVIPLAVDDSFQPSLESSKQNFINKYGLFRPYLLLVGALHPRRNFHRLIQAFKLLKQDKRVKHELIIIGIAFSKHYENSIRQSINEENLNNDIKILGYIPESDLIQFYSFSDAFIYPSIYEGFGLPLLEAMACGTPIISSNCSSMVEVTGDASLSFDPYDVMSIYHALKIIVNNQQLRFELKQKGNIIKEKFSWKRTAEETLEVFLRIANK